MGIKVLVKINTLIGWQDFTGNSLIYFAESDNIVDALTETIEVFDCPLAEQTFLLREQRFQLIKKLQEQNPTRSRVGSTGMQMEPVRIVGKTDQRFTLDERIVSLKRNLELVDNARSNFRGTIKFTYEQWKGENKHSSAYMAERIETFKAALPMLDRWHKNLYNLHAQLLEKNDQLVVNSVPFVEPVERVRLASQAFDEHRKQKQSEANSNEQDQPNEYEYFVAGLS